MMSGVMGAAHSRGVTLLSARVKELREQRGWSQYDLAVKSGMSPTNVWKIENGRTSNPGRGTLQKLARAFGIEIAELLDPEPIEPENRADVVRRFAMLLASNDPNISPDAAEEALSKYLQLPAEDRVYILGLVDRLADARQIKGDEVAD